MSRKYKIDIHKHMTDTELDEEKTKFTDKIMKAIEKYEKDPLNTG